jgi:hypothetical protein
MPAPGFSGTGVFSWGFGLGLARKSWATVRNLEITSPLFKVEALTLKLQTLDFKVVAVGRV